LDGFGNPSNTRTWQSAGAFQSTDKTMNEQALIALLVLIGLILVTNFVLYGIVRGFTRGDNSRWMRALRDSLSKPLEPKDKSMDELRKKIEELEAKQGKGKRDSS
jgi:hypothetical protein